MQWLKEDFLKYIDDWEDGVMKRKKFTVTQKYKMLLSQETLLGIRMTGNEKTDCQECDTNQSFLL